MFQGLYNKEEQIIETGEVNYMLSNVQFGAPLDYDGIRYNDLTDRRKEQRAIADKFQKDMFNKIKEIQDEDGVNAIIFSDAIVQWELQNIIDGDTAFAGFSVAFVMCYFVFHLKSFFLALVGTAMISFSFPFS